MTPDWESLQGAIDGEVALHDSPAYEDGRKVFNARFHDVRPQAIVRCATPEDVSEVVAFVRRHRLEHATRSGGHCFAGRSSTQGTVIDVTPMASVSVSGAVATMGAGARLGEVYEALDEHGLTIPGGTCPEVGIAGLALGGGLGILGRKYGVTSDHLVGAQIVLADGRILECDQNHDPDLFWALRGAGAGNFGVVTSLAFRTVPAPEATNFHAAWSFSEALAVIEAWQGWAPRGVDELAASLKVTVAGEVDRPPSVDLYGALLGSESEAMELLDQLVRRAGSDPRATSGERMSSSETRSFWAQLGAAEHDASRVAHSQPPFLFSKSEFFGRALPAEAIAALLEVFGQERSPGEERELDFMPWGGAYSRVPPDATAFVHRDELFQLKHALVVDPSASLGDKQAAHRWVTRSWASVHPWGSGRVFQNFPDPDLDEWPEAYFGTNLDRLVRVKAHYDPENFFRSHESLGVS
jgi:FAD/FMN-containing dehydrogenase